MNHEPLRAVVQSLAECLSSHPADLRIEIVPGSDRVEISICPNREDFGKLLGRSGNNAKAIKTIAQSITEKDFKWASVKIEEGWTGENQRTPTMEWNRGHATLMRSRLESICAILLPGHVIADHSDANHDEFVITAEDREKADNVAVALRGIFKAYGARFSRFVNVKFAHESVAA